MRKILKPRNLIWLTMPILIWWVIVDMPFTNVWDTLANLDWIQIGFLILFNAFIIMMLCLRWWLVLYAQGHRLPFFNLVGYRLTAFAISYFTPGTQFGGEPYQVYSSHQKHKISIENATAAVSLDKLFELLTNFTFLVIGFLVIMKYKMLSTANPNLIIPVLFILIILPLLYLFLLFINKSPLKWIFANLPRRLRVHFRFDRFLHIIEKTEKQISLLLNKKPVFIVSLTMLSALIWILLISEYWLTLKFLGVSFNLSQVVIALTAARLAFLMPIPGGLGALEASQIVAMQALGINPAIGVSVSLLIRARDLLFGGMGILNGAFQNGYKFSRPIVSKKRQAFNMSSKESFHP